MLFHHFDRASNSWKRKPDYQQSGVWETDESLLERHHLVSWGQRSRAYYCDTWPNGWREKGDADKIIRLSHTGWYADSSWQSVIRGFVLQLPARGGKEVYVPATYCTGWDGVTLYPNDWSSDETEAARSADHYAECEADRSREYYAQDSAEQEIAFLRDEIGAARKSTLALIREIKAAKRAFSPMVCKALTDELRRQWRQREKAFRRITALQENFWLAVEV